MIYTIGNTENYEKFFQQQAYPRKAIGGSVWKTFDEAKFCCGRGDLYSVYGVEADWEKDTIKKGDHSWNDLLINAVLVKI